MDFSFINLIVNDEIYFTKDFTLFSLVPLDKYFKWSEVLESDFKGFTLDLKASKLVNTITPRLNFATL